MKIYNSLENVLKGSFFESSLINSKDNYCNVHDILQWLNMKNFDKNFNVKRIPIDNINKWTFTTNQCEIIHNSGKFFKIEGIRVKTNYGLIREWDQPIINQPEIGILGIITKKFEDKRFFLMQAKMEPGNVNILQLSPTLQATKSNYTKVHQGKTPKFIEYFINPSLSNVLIDLLQTEQGGRFLKKRNRNMIVEIYDDIEIDDEYIWLTLAEIKELINKDNIVNMDARSVISIIPLIDKEIITYINTLDILNKNSLIISNHNIQGFGLEILKSVCLSELNLNSEEKILSWYTQQKCFFELEVEKTSLSKLRNWKISKDRIYNSDRFFSVIGVEVHSGTREVVNWSQPLIHDKNLGLIGFITKKINNVLHFLVQAKVEPGNIDIIELSPTVSCSNYEYIINSKVKIPFIEYFINENLRVVHFDSIQSEEGGRFFHMQNRNLIIEVKSDEILDIPNNYIWMTLNQMINFIKYGMFNIEARSIFSALRFF